MLHEELGQKECWKNSNCHIIWLKYRGMENTPKQRPVRNPVPRIFGSIKKTCQCLQWVVPGCVRNFSPFYFAGVCLTSEAPNANRLCKKLCIFEMFVVYSGFTSFLRNFLKLHSSMILLFRLKGL